MSYDTHMLLRTSLSAAEVSATLVHDSALEDLALIESGRYVTMGGNEVSLEVTPWEEDDRTLIENGFETATVRVMFIPARGQVAGEQFRRMFAAVLRLVPGDACAQDQGGGPLGLLRVNGSVYINPDFIWPEDLFDYGYTPKQLVVGIPSITVEAEAEKGPEGSQQRNYAALGRAP